MESSDDVITGTTERRLASTSLDYNNIVIVMSRGRSGSSLLCDYIGNLVGFPGHFGPELFGGGIDDMKKVDEPIRRMQKYLKSRQDEHPGKIVGFKWKPYYFDDKYTKALNWVAHHHIKVVVNTRNPLDIAISTAKQHADRTIEYHCKVNDKACQKKVKAIRVTIDTSRIIHTLDAFFADHVKLIRYLEQTNVKYLNITYENLNWGNEDERLVQMKRLGQFVNPKRKKVTGAVFSVPIAYTGNIHQADTVKNYAELVKVLNGTKYENLLH